MVGKECGGILGALGEGFEVTADDGAVFSDGASASGGVDDHREVIWHGGGEGLGAGFGFGEVPSVGMESTATSGIGFPNSESNPAEESACGFVNSGIEDAHDATFEEVDLTDDRGKFFGGNGGPRIEFRKGGRVGFGGLTTEEF